MQKDRRSFFSLSSAGPLSAEGEKASFFPCLHRIASMNDKEATLMFNYNYQAQHDYKPERTQPPVSPKSWEERWFSVAGDLDDFIFYDPTDRSPAGCSDR